MIVNFNGGDLTPSCLASLSESEFAPSAVLVIDNASTDGSKETLQPEHGKSIELIANNENLGFAKACNQGMKRACELGADFVFLFNNDARLESNALGTLVEAAGRHPKAGLLGGKIYFGDGPKLWCAGMNVGFYPNLQDLRGFGKVDVGKFDVEEKVDALTGCGLLIRRAFIDEGGIFDEDFFVYVEDLELSLRAQSTGWTCLYVPAAVFYHDAGSTSGQGYSAWRKYMLAYNLVLFLKKQGNIRLWLSFLILDVLCWPFVLLVAILTGRSSGALAKGRGLLHAFLNTAANPG
ncbi:MAG: GT2 family glycosyltransferase [Planctomycetota bacterium]